MAPKEQKVTGDLTISKAEVEKMGLQLRERFLEEAELNPNQYDVIDVEKIKNDDWYCQRFILHQRFLLGDKADVEAALDQCKTALKWRKEFCANEIKESNVSIEIFEKKGVFPYGKDKLGNNILVLVGRLHKRDAEIQKEIRRLLTFWIEKLDKESNGNKINVILNCEGAGISNLDLDIIRFIFNTFRANYPYFLENIFVYNMPWIFNAAWKLIKTWLPEDAVYKIKFVNNKSILEYIDAESLPESLGGTRSDEEDDKLLEDYKKAVKAQLEEALKGPDPGMTLVKDRGNEKSGVSYLEVKPGHLLKFSNLEVTNKRPVFLVLKNICSQEIGFRIRSNNIKAFKVRPFNGVIKRGSSVDISIQLSEGHTFNGQEKFLIQAIPVGHSKLSTGSFNVLWKNCASSKQMEYKIKCLLEEEIIVPVRAKTLGSSETPTSTSSFVTSDAHFKKIQELETSVQELKYWNCLLKIAVFFLILVNLLFFAVYFFSDEIHAVTYNLKNILKSFSTGSKINV